MSFQLVGILLLLLGLWTFLTRSDRLLHAALFFTFFENVAIVVIRRPDGEYGVSAWLYFLGLAVVSHLIRKQREIVSRESLRTRPHALPLALFVAVCVFSLVVTYRIAGQESVLPASILQRAYPHPIVLDSANFVVLVPMLAATALALMLANSVHTYDDLVTHLRTVALSVTTVAALALLEFASASLGAANPLSAIRAIEPTRQAVQLGSSEFFRLTSVSFEPSFLARVLLVGVCVLGAARVFGLRLFSRVLDLLALVILLGALFLTGTSTGYVGVAAGLLAAAVFTRRRGRSRTRLRVIGAALGILAIGFWTYRNSAGVRSAIDLLVLDKFQSDSYLERTTATANALEVLQRHPILGVGLGEVASYDLVAKLGSNIGYMGIAAYALLVGGTLLRLWWTGTGRLASDAARAVPAVLGTVILMLQVVFHFTGFFFEFAYFWAVIGLAWAASGLPEASSENVRRSVNVGSRRHPSPRGLHQ